MSSRKDMPKSLKWLYQLITGTGKLYCCMYGIDY